MKTLLEPTQSKPYPAWLAVVMTIASFMVSQILAAILVSVMLFLIGGRSWNIETNPVPQFLIIASTSLINLGLIHAFLQYFKSSFTNLGLNRINLIYVVYALIGFAAYFVLYLIVLGILTQVVPSLDLNQKQELGFSTATRGGSLVVIFISLVLIPPVVEEIIMRGFLFGGLRNQLSWPVATIITSLLFAAAHLPEGHGGLLWIGAVDTFMLSLILCFLREKTGSLWPSIGVHMIKNALAFVVLFDVIHIVM